MIIGLTGLAGAGKDTVADILVRDHDFAKVALADPLKRFCQEVFRFSEEQLWGQSDLRNQPDSRYLLGRPVKDQDPFLTPRHALQQLGTEWGRACYKNVWIDYGLNAAKLLLTCDKLYYTGPTGIISPEGFYQQYKGVVFPDVRFLNEAQAIHAAGGYVVRVSRLLSDGTFYSSLSGVPSTHASEKGTQEITEIDASINNWETDKWEENLNQAASWLVGFLKKK